MRTLLVLSLFIVVGCNSQPKPKEDLTTKMKFCMRECVKDQFKSFHSKGESWGTGSSSMNGLQDTEIMSKVENQCKEFLEGETCCKWSPGGYSHVSYWFSGRNYGVCK